MWNLGLKEPVMQGNHSNERNSFDRNSPQKGMWNYGLKGPGIQGNHSNERDSYVRLCTYLSYYYSQLTITFLNVHHIHCYTTLFRSTVAVNKGEHSKERNSFDRNYPLKGMWNLGLKEPGMWENNRNYINSYVRLCTYLSYSYSQMTTYIKRYPKT